MGSRARGCGQNAKARRWSPTTKTMQATRWGMFCPFRTTRWSFERSLCTLQHLHRPGPWCGLGGSALGCLRLCKDQPERPWVPLVEPATQPHYAQNKECILCYQATRAQTTVSAVPSFPKQRRTRSRHRSQSILSSTRSRCACPSACMRARLVLLAQPTRRPLATISSNGSASHTSCMLIQRACPGIFPPRKWWLTRCTSTGYMAQYTGTHRQPRQRSRRQNISCRLACKYSQSARQMRYHTHAQVKRQCGIRP